MQQASPYIVYVDESGDHALDALDPTYPIFVLAFCLFSKVSYAHSVIPTLIDFKFKYFGHDQVVLHESDIRKAKPPFEFLFNRAVRDNFMQDLNAVVESSDFSIIAGVIRKSEPSVDSTDRNRNPYHVALQSCLDRLWEFLETHAHPVAETYIIFEARGKMPTSSWNFGEFVMVETATAFVTRSAFSSPKNRSIHPDFSWQIWSPDRSEEKRSFPIRKTGPSISSKRNFLHRPKVIIPDGG